MAQPETGTAIEANPEFSDLVGTYHRIGGLGPAYEVLRILDQTKARIVLIETGEEVDYHIDDILKDPHPDESYVEPIDEGDDVLEAIGPVDLETSKQLVGEWRKFGRYGPRYEVLSIESATEAKIRVHTSGEVTAYPIADILRDPVDRCLRSRSTW